jgi:redox-sensing transcriptional repressor
MPKAIILRLESYLTYLGQLESQGKTSATSEELARLFGISSSRVRQDMVALGNVGKPRSGYSIPGLRRAIMHELDVQNPKAIALVGLGNMGRALAGSHIWDHGGFVLRAIFDSDPRIVGEEYAGLKVRSMSELFGVVKSEGIRAGCIAVPAAWAHQVADLMAAAGIKGIWNFAPVELTAPSGVLVENQRLQEGLMTLSYRMKQAAG